MAFAVTHSVFREHHTGRWHPESHRRLDAAVEGARRAGVGVELLEQQHRDTERIIAAVHDRKLAESLDRACGEGAPFFGSLDNAISPATARAARMAVGAGLSAAEKVLHGSDGRGFVIARPPGHHAERARAMGFCYFNSIACTAEWLREQPGIERVFILDWDVHHGNGTQEIFQSRSDVFYLSVHSYPFFPGTGAADERGTGEGEGATLNLPLEAGEGDETYLDLFERRILPEIEVFAPDVILISAGFDAHRDDPIGNMKVSSEAFGEMTALVAETADRICHGRVVSFLEGGYDPDALSSSIEHHLARL